MATFFHHCPLKKHSVLSECFLTEWKAFKSTSIIQLSNCDVSCPSLKEMCLIYESRWQISPQLCEMNALHCCMISRFTRHKCLTTTLCVGPSPCVVAHRESDPWQSLAHPGSSVVGEGHQEHHRGPGDWGMEVGRWDPSNQELVGERWVG